MILIGLCGQSGSGKSTVASMIREKGFECIDCDLLARQIVEKGEKCLRELSLVFGDDIISKDGSLDRRRLASIAFSDNILTKKLNDITHKYIMGKLNEMISGFEDVGKSVAFIDAPLLFESGLAKRCYKTVCVVASEEKKRQRLEKRDAISYKEIEKRLSQQLCDEELIRKCDYVIENNAGIDELCQKLSMILKELPL